MSDMSNEQFQRDTIEYRTASNARRIALEKKWGPRADYFCAAPKSRLKPIEMTEDEVTHDQQVKRDNQRDETRTTRNFLRATNPQGRR